ncbi:unnamed protein product, partial [Allacma fusca]
KLGNMVSVPSDKKLTSDEIIIHTDLFKDVNTVIWNRNWGMAITHFRSLISAWDSFTDAVNPPEVAIEMMDHASDYVAEIQGRLASIRAAGSRAAKQDILLHMRRILMALTEHILRAII